MLSYNLRSVMLERCNDDGWTPSRALLRLHAGAVSARSVCHQNDDRPASSQSDVGHLPLPRGRTARSLRQPTANAASRAVRDRDCCGVIWRSGPQVSNTGVRGDVTQVSSSGPSTTPAYMARPREFDRTDALDAAMHVFWQHGYEASSLRKLLDAMDLSYSSFYQTFGSKRKLFKEALHRYLDLVVQDMHTALEEAPSAYAFLKALLIGVADDAREGDTRGDLLMNTATEFGQQDASIAALVLAGKRRPLGVICAAVEQAQREGDVDAAQETDALARYVLMSYAGLKTMVKAGGTAEEVQSAAELALRTLR